MVFQLQLRSRLRLSSLIAALALVFTSAQAFADPNLAAQYLRDSQQYFNDGQFFRSARYAFAAAEQNPQIKSDAYSWITVSLAEAGMYNSAVYFFVRTLQSGNKTRQQSSQ